MSFKARRLILKNIDNDGFQGREFHPEQKHVGQTFLVLASYIHFFNPYAEPAIIDSHNFRRLHENAFSIAWSLDQAVEVFCCISQEDGERVELLGHEIVWAAI